MIELDSLQNKMDDLTPRQIVKKLDTHIVGQNEAKKSVAIALRNRTRRKKLDPEMQEEIVPKNIVMIGPTGVGKTEIARRLSRLVNAPFVKVEITKYTEVGYMGRDVESMVRDLTAISVNMVKKEFSKLVEELAGKNSEERILDILLPNTAKDIHGFSEHGFSFSDSENIQPQEDEDDSDDENREKFRAQLRAGKLDEMMIEYEAEAPSAIPVMSVLSGSGLEDIDMQIQSMLGDIMPKKSRKSKLTVAEAREVFVSEETEKLIDMEKVRSEAVKRAEEMGIIFVDEIDKIAGTEARSGPDVSRQGVQRDLLPIVEGTVVNTKYGPVKTDHVLFIAAGAFNVSKPSDLIPELQGRFPIRVELNSLSKEDFKKILTVPKNSITKQYIEMLKTEGIVLSFKKSAINEIADIAQRVNDEHENIGARRLHTIMEKLLEEVLFDAPDLPESEKTISVDAQFVKDKLESTIQDRDLSRYIL